MRRIFTTLLFSATLLSCLVSCGGKPSDPNMINYIGRYQTETINGKEVTTFSYTASGFEFKVNVTSESYTLGVNLFSQTFDGFSEQYINVYVDDVLMEKVKLDKSENCVLISNLSVGEHVVRINKLNEAQFSKMGLIDYVLENVEIVEISKRNKKIVEFYGDSITCGYGNLATQREGFSMLTEDGMQSYGQLTADHLNWDSSIISYSGIALAMSPFNSPYTLMDKYNTVDGYKPVTVSAISSTYVGSEIARRSSTDLTVSGATVTAPAGYYSAAASKSVATMTLPTAAASSASERASFREDKVSPKAAFSL
jgi:hypothetical protein